MKNEALNGRIPGYVLKFQLKMKEPQNIMMRFQPGKNLYL
jgi:hypothetical protein